MGSTLDYCSRIKRYRNKYVTQSQQRRTERVLYKGLRKCRKLTNIVRVCKCNQSGHDVVKLRKLKVINR